LAPDRQMPRLASSSFQQWARKAQVPSIAEQDTESIGSEVILWADTFNNYYRPEVSRAALAELTHAGFKVRVSRKHFCCGRPLYDFGMLDQARQYLAHILEGLATQIDAGMPIVVLEPSCASVFRDELRNLFPG